MALVMRVCLIFDSAVVEERETLDENLDDYFRFSVDDRSSDGIISGTSTSMGTSFSREKPALSEPYNILAAMCETLEYLQDEGEYLQTRHLVIEHLWSGEEEQYEKLGCVG